MPPHLLLIAATTGYQAHALVDAAHAVGARLTLASDRCDQLPDPWGDRAVAVRFEPAHLPAAIATLRPYAPFDGVVACGDAAAVLAAGIAAEFGLRFHSPAGAARAHDKFAFQQALAAAALPRPWVRLLPAGVATAPDFPCVVKPLSLSASRGVIRANDTAEFAAAVQRIRRLLPPAAALIIEEYLDGPEFALEGLIDASGLHALAIFDKPDPLAGPYFEETIYLTPSRLDPVRQARLQTAVATAARAAALGPGPIHAEVRWCGDTPYVLEIAARPIGGLCSRALHFTDGARHASLEEVLVRAALGEPTSAWRREPPASGVMMIPIPGAGILHAVTGVDAARAVPGVDAVEITARIGQAITPLPEGATYLGFIFARAATPAAAERALRRAHAQLDIRLRPTLPVV